MNEIVFLILLTLNGTGNSFQWHYHEMPNMQVCQECVDNAKISIPKGGDAEAAVVIYCAKDKVKTQLSRERYAK